MALSGQPSNFAHLRVHDEQLVRLGLMAIDVPVPPLAAQQAFNRLQAEVGALKAKHAAIRQTNAALIPATLERVFAGNP